MKPDDDQEYEEYLRAHLEEGRAEGQAYFREMIRPLFRRADRGRRARMEEFEELAARNPDTIREILRNGSRPD